MIGSRAHRASLIELINQKEVLGDLFNQLRLALQRRMNDRPAQVSFRLYLLPHTTFQHPSPKKNEKERKK